MLIIGGGIANFTNVAATFKVSFLNTRVNNSLCNINLSLINVISTGWPLTLKTGKSGKCQGKNIFFMKKSGKNEIVLANVLENVDVTHFISIFCQRLSVIFAILLTYWSQGKLTQVREISYKADTLKNGHNVQ